MNIEPFDLERWLHHPNQLNLGGAGITQLRMKDITDAVDLNMVMTYGGVTNGSAELRAEIADLYDRVSEENVLVTTGTAEANYLVLNSLLEQGDEMVACSPSYMQCVGIARRLGARVAVCELKETEAYRIDIEELRRLVSPKTKLISLVNPNNPTGSVISSAEMQAICAIAESVGAWVLNDGALRGLEPDDEIAATSVEVYEKGVSTGSLTKPGLMGLRIGWIVATQHLLDRCWVYKDYTTLSHSGLGEHFATLALEATAFAAILRRARNVISHHRAILSDWIASHDPIFEWVPPKAGHTGFIKYDLDVESVELCTELLEEESVLLSPGDYFGSPKHLRIRYSCEEDLLVEALTRFSRFLSRNYLK